jgi:hypothetical protein
MINNAQIQTGWIAEIKERTNITVLVPAVEVREDLWKGEKFTYPNIRVKLGNLTPANRNPDCNTFNSPVSIHIFTEQKSSKTTDEIAGVVATEFIGKTFKNNGIKYYGIVLESLVPADVPEDDPNSWLAIVNLNLMVSPA